MAVRTYRELDVWKIAMELVEAVYVASTTWDKDERFGLTSQARRAAVSIPANIAEGFGRMTKRDYTKFLFIARGSVMELQVHLNIAVRVGVASRENIRAAWKLSMSVVKMLTALIRSLTRSGEIDPTKTLDPRPKTPRSEPRGSVR